MTEQVLSKCPRTHCLLPVCACIVSDACGYTYCTHLYRLECYYTNHSLPVFLLLQNFAATCDSCLHNVNNNGYSRFSCDPFACDPYILYMYTNFPIVHTFIDNCEYFAIYILLAYYYTYVIFLYRCRADEQLG